MTRKPYEAEETVAIQPPSLSSGLAQAVPAWVFSPNLPPSDATRQPPCLLSAFQRYLAPIQQVLSRPQYH